MEEYSKLFEQVLLQNNKYKEIQKEVSSKVVLMYSNTPRDWFISQYTDFNILPY